MRIQLALVFLVGCSAASSSSGGGNDGTSGAGNAPSSGAPGFTPGDPSSTGHCGAQTFAVGASRVDPNVMLVIDRSGSMVDKVGGTKKWDALKDSMHALLAQHAEDARWGLALFPKRASPQCTTGEIDLDIAPGQAPAVLSTIDSMETNGDKVRSYTDPTILGQGTPTAETLAVVEHEVANLNDSTRENIVLLMTDGIPNCGSDAVNRVTNTIASLYSKNVKTYVVGLGSETSSQPETLAAWAQAGHTARSASPAYFQANTASELSDAFMQIVGGVISCEFALDRDPGDPSLLAAFIDGNAVSNDAQNGATYDAASNSMVFHGVACDAVKAAGGATVELRYGCAAQPIL